MTSRLWQRVSKNELSHTDCGQAGSTNSPGRPEKPQLVPPAMVPRRRLGNPLGRAALIHAIAHIEFNAINLALDAACRFAEMPPAYYRDWASVTADEARHYSMLNERLVELGFAYGDFPAHDGLWEMAVKTRHSCLERMALVPRVLEARGLDVTPGMISRLDAAGDTQTVSVLEVILREEVRHVEIGTRWFRHCCALEGKEPSQEFLRLLDEHFNGSLRGPFNVAARRQAGFSDVEMEAISTT
ncbi:MAG: ferritin-like domain-containing protein [Xanthomonadales bacterium]|nr:ferritin-like domain-containing protein [Xanthomonadales bacterium]